MEKLDKTIVGIVIAIEIVMILLFWFDVITEDIFMYLTIAAMIIVAIVYARKKI